VCSLFCICCSPSHSVLESLESHVLPVGVWNDVLGKIAQWFKTGDLFKESLEYVIAFRWVPTIQFLESVAHFLAILVIPFCRRGSGLLILESCSSKRRYKMLAYNSCRFMRYLPNSSFIHNLTRKLTPRSNFRPPNQQRKRHQSQHRTNTT
jgi:hypothetical protein